MKIPVPRIENKTLLIRPYGLKDAVALYKMMKANRESLYHTFPQSLTGTSTLMRTRQYVLTKQGDRKAGTLIVCGVFKMPEERLIGHVLFTKFDWSVPKCDMGYFIDGEEAGKGYGTASAKMLADWGFSELKLEKITLRVWPENLVSIAVAKKLGAREAGLAKRDFRTLDGKVLDCVYYELYR